MRFGRFGKRRLDDERDDSVETHQHHVADRASHGLFTG